MAYSADSSTPIDVGALFGPGKQQPWWNTAHSEQTGQVPGRLVSNEEGPRIPSQSARSEDIPLPSWLMDFSPAEDLVERLEVEVEETGSGIGLEDLDSDTEFSAALSATKSMADIRNLLRARPQPERYALAIQHLLDAKWKTEHLEQLLTDQLLDCQELESRLQIIQHICKHHDSRYPDLLRMIRSEVALGRVRRKELEALFHHLPMVRFGEDEDISQSARNIRIARHYGHLVAAVTMSPNLNLDEIDSRIYHDISLLLRDVPLLTEVASVSKLLLDEVPHVVLDNISQALQKWIDRACSRTKVKEHNRDIDNMASFLESLPPNAFVALVTRTSEVICAPGTKDASKQQQLTVWSTLLKRMSPKTAVLDSRLWIDSISYSRDMNSTTLTEKQSIFIRLWIISILSTKTLRFQTSDVHQTLLRNLFFDFQNLTPDDDYLESLISTANSLPLRVPQLLSTLINMAPIANSNVSVIRASLAPSRLSSSLSALLSDSLYAFQHDTIYRSSSAYLTDNISRISERINSNLTQFVRYACNLILHDESAPKLFIRLLRHNQPFKIALTFSANPKVAKSSNHNLSAFPLPLESLLVIEMIASSFAITPTLTPRQAYRKVRWCYLFLHRHGAPITPAITRALYHAGISRYKNRGLSPEQFDWIMKKVTEVEGKETATSLAVGGDEGYENIIKKCIAQEGEGQKDGRRIEQGIGRPPHEFNKEQKILRLKTAVREPRQLVRKFQM